MKKKLGMTLLAAAAAITFTATPALASANSGCGEYCANPGAESMNGGKVVENRPMAGTVGKADDKNPPGQFKNGGDPNNGYECDGNMGIALGNPAHTGCDPSS